MKRVLAVIMLVSAVGLTLSCSKDNTIFGGDFGSIIVCDPLGFSDVDNNQTLDLESSITAFDLLGVAIDNQTVNVEFGSAVTVVDNLTNNTTMDIDGDTGSTDQNGDLELLVDCNEVGNPQNPCSVEYTTTIEGNTRDCSVTFVD